MSRGWEFRAWTWHALAQVSMRGPGGSATPEEIDAIRTEILGYNRAVCPIVMVPRAWPPNSGDNPNDC